MEGEEGEEEEGGDRQRGQRQMRERTRELRRLIFVVSIWGMGGGY